MPYITKVSLKNAQQETIRQALEWCTFCQNRDATFKFSIQGNFIIIESPTKTQAFKRGSAIKQKFNLYYNVEFRNTNKQKHET